ncbi:AAA family ATPase [Haloarcula hispanica]|uniref:ATP-binding cassette domain-containing protein n=1 Tax=Haloarcula hispanica TaxID=51589 RepID=A0A482SWS6_HALHI|nr:AAA family ATPase [Haloarcula hispanica]MCJ0621383.1 AAA family ATPase [Haloarcula hispanica]RYJ07698.1 ATP-binding cassette domain-containing protein [Haloarcula hispanica]
MSDDSMKIDSLQLQGYTVFERQNLQNFGDLNIIIGPNNSGKTSLLRAITKISKIERGRAPLQDSERFYEQQDRRVRLDFSFADENIVLESDNMGSLELPGEGSFDEPDVLFCETERLTDYKNTNLDEFLSDQLQSVDSEKFLNALNEIVDPNIADLYGSLTGGGDLQLSTSDQDGNTLRHELNRHGSGVKSIAMLLADIYAADPDTLLIDEPEMGLYPAAKRRFLKLLLELSEVHQVFITTQDASFVNPLFWRDSEQDISVYHYSVSRNMQGRQPFLDLEVNEPSTFAGFLPQATSIKDYHLYVEGKDDVKVIRSYLHSFLDRAASGETQGDLLDRTEIYHLNGNNWEHFLSTIPSSPYSSVVLLDNDMDGQADNVIRRYEESGYQSFPDFVKCEDTVDIRENLRNSTVPVYLLNHDDISDYIGVDNKQDIAEEAWNKEVIPREIVNVFYSLYEEELSSHEVVKDRIGKENTRPYPPKPTDKLSMDPTTEAKKQITDAIEEYVRVVKPDGEIVPSPKLDQLDTHSQITAILLGMRAGAMSGVLKETEAEASVEELSRKIKATKNTVMSAKNQLQFITSKDGKVYIADQDLEDAAQYLLEGSD